jgi:RND family efflux transporter MFP subunit
MNTLQFLADWALRSSILVLSGALLLWALRVKDPSIRLMAWTVLLCSSLAIPVLAAALPKMPLRFMRLASRSVEEPAVIGSPEQPVGVVSRARAEPETRAARISKRFDWVTAAVTVYAAVAFALLLRLCLGLAMSLRLLRSSRATEESTEGIEIRESDYGTTPVTLGIMHPAIVLPADWSQWDDAKRDAVLAHERSHIQRRDPIVQLLSAIHRALLWHSPLSWFLHRSIVRTAEEASDDAAITVVRDRAGYAEVVLGFIQRGVRRPNWLGIPMARYGSAAQRIHRILDSTALSRGVTRQSLAAILALASPIAYVIAAAGPQGAPQAGVVTVPAAEKANAVETQPSTQNSGEVSVRAVPRGRGGGVMAPQTGAWGLGLVAAYTVTIKPRVDGELMSVNFKEGELVKTGQMLAQIDPRPFQLQMSEAEGQLARDQARLAEARLTQNTTSKQQFDTQIAQVEGNIRSDQAKVDSAKLQLTYANITSPITGVAGLRLVDPGNMIRASDTTGIVVINQLQPISVVFNLAEDSLPQVLARLRGGATLSAEAWSRDLTMRFATGRLTALDNEIDASNGTAKLKAEFENKDYALFPNQFVNVRLPLAGK